MKKILLALLILLALAGLALGAWFFFTQGDSLNGKEEIRHHVPPLTKEYKNKTYRFSLMMPEEFTVAELPEGENTYVVFQDLEGYGIQVALSPHEHTDVTFTVEDLKLLDPALTVTSPEVVELGELGSGVAFLSDNPAFGGASREVWFIFRGTLYQISTYARFDPLLKAMFATWNFY